MMSMPQIILTVGSDCRVGKMLSGIEVTRTARERGLGCRILSNGTKRDYGMGLGYCD